MLALSLWVCPVLGAAESAALSGLTLPDGSVRTPLANSMRVQGIPVDAEVFVAPLSLQETADMLALQADSPPSLLVLSDSVLLAWYTDKQHWLVRLQAQGEAHTHGTISVLPTPQPVASDQASQMALFGGASPPVWVPAHATQLFELDSAEGSQRTKQSIYMHGLAPERLWPLIHQKLRGAGWRQEPGDLAHGGAGRWAKGRRVLSLLVLPHTSGSGILATETEPL